jgi:hypothetical protein
MDAGRGAIMPPLCYAGGESVPLAEVFKFLNIERDLGFIVGC